MFKLLSSLIHPFAIKSPPTKESDKALKKIVKSTFQEMASKKMSLDKVSGSIKVVSLGSSHGDYGFNPSMIDRSFNLCGVSMDMKQSLEIYKKVISPLPMIENVIIFYSVFSPGAVLHLGNERARCGVYASVFGLPVDYDDEVISTAFRLAEDLKGSEIKEPSFMGFKPNNRYAFPESLGAKKRAGDHLRTRARGGSDGFLRQLIERIATDGRKATIVIPPARSDYRDAIELTEEELFTEVRTIAAEAGASVFCLYHSTDFTDDDFIDFDHLDPQKSGARKLTRQIGHLIATRPQSD